MEASPGFSPTPPGPRPAPESLHPALWRADQLGRSAGKGLATGFAALDAELPGAGWPVGTLTELLLPHPGVGELRLLAPALVRVMTGQGTDKVARSVMLFDPPAEPCGWALGLLGLDVRQLLLVRGRDGLRGRGRRLLPAADTAKRRAAPSLDDPPRGANAVRGVQGADTSKRRAAPSLDDPPRGANAVRGVQGADILWALEQALASGHVGAVLAWLPARLRADTLRRLQLAAQAHPGPVFLFREVEARLKPSAAPLRLQLDAAGPDQLRLRVLKRRGAPQADPLCLALAPVLSASARARAGAARTPARGLPVAAQALPA